MRIEGPPLRHSWLPVWDVARVTESISAGAVHRALDPIARAELDGIGDLSAKVAGALQHPKPLDISLPVFNAVLAAQYYELFAVLGLPRTMQVYEPCVGGSNPVIIGAAAHSGEQARYMAMNLNRKLREELRAKTAHLRMSITIIEEDAQAACAVLPAESCDVACFHHAVNDILQTAVAESHGMDTTHIDWFPNERKMIEWLAEEVAMDGLDERGRPELMEIVTGAVRLVRPGGYLIFDHWNWCKYVGVEWFPWELFYQLIPMTRRWITESKLPLTEIQIEGADGQWWMVLRKDEG